MTSPCPLCSAAEVAPFYSDALRPYLLCQGCDLVFVPSGWHLGPHQENAQYDLHRNSPDDPGYRRFLSRLVEPLLDRIPPAARVLDFGSGPGPTLSVMLRERGYKTWNYDPFYAPDRTVLEHTYQAITATEVIEHLARPGEVLRRLWASVEPGGTLGVMTRFRPEPARFAGWHYRRDPTHVAFYSPACLRWTAAMLGGDLWLKEPDVALLTKPHSARAAGPR